MDSVGADLTSLPPEAIEAHQAEFHIQKRVQEVNEELSAQTTLKNEHDKRIKHNDKEIARLTHMHEQSTAPVQTNKYTQVMKELLSVKGQSEGLMNKFDGLTAQKETMHGRINEMRYILEQYKDELRDLGGDPD